MKKVISNVIFVIYVVIAIFVTVCLLSYNEFKVTEFGDNSLVIITDDELSPEYEKGDLVIVTKSKLIPVGEKAFFYDTYNRKIEIKLGEIVEAQRVSSSEVTYELEGKHKISSEYVLGPSSTTSKIPKVGTILSILESKWGFLFIIVLPALLAFIYQISVVISELRKSKEGNKGKKVSNEQTK